jgi:hypothetical protein
MAWCTFSSDDFQCDLRLVSLVDGYSIITAHERILGDIPATEHLQTEGLEAELEDAERAQMAYVRTAPREKLDLPFAGQEFRFDEFEDFADKVRELADLGYRIPADVAADIGIPTIQPAR